MQIQKIHLFIICGAIFVYLLLNVLDSSNEKYDIDLDETQKNLLVAIVVVILGFGLLYIKPSNLISESQSISNSFIPTHL
jgi:hypothetical protein